MSISPAFAKFAPAQLEQAEKAYNQALYATALKIVIPSRATDYAASLLEAKIYESSDKNSTYEYIRSGDLASQKSYAVMWRGYSLFLGHRYSEAQELLKSAVGLDPKNPVAHALFGCCLCYLDEVDQGMAEFKMAAQVDPKKSVDEYLARAFVGAGESKKAEQIFNKIVAQNPKSARVYILRGDFFYDAGRFQNALTDYEKAVQLSPGSAYAHYRKGRALRELKQYEQVIPEAMKGASLEDVPELTDKSKRLLSRAYADTKQYQKAVDVLKPMLAPLARTNHISSTEKLMLLDLAEDYENVHDYKNAKLAVDLVYRVDPKSTEALAKRARLFSELNDPVNSLRDYTNLIKTDPTNSQWLLQRAKIFQKLGKSENAKADLKQAKELED